MFVLPKSGKVISAHRLPPARRERNGWPKSADGMASHAQSVPPAIARALERWEERGAEARLEQATVLRLKSPEMLQELRASRVARFLGDPLGPVAVIVKPGAWEKVQRFLAEQGYLVDERL